MWNNWQKNYFTLTNKCRVYLTTETGDPINDWEYTNITCNAGRQSIALQIMDDGTGTDLGRAKYIALGDGTTPATITDASLVNELVRNPIDPNLASNLNTVCKVYTRYPVGTSYTINEAGLFVWPSASAFAGSGAMLARSVFATPIVKNTNEVLTIEREISVVNATV